MISTEMVTERLKMVIDPETHLNVVEMGLIRNVEVKKTDGKSTIFILYTLTTPGCPLAGTFPTLMHNALKGLEDGFEPGRDVTIELTFNPPWTINDLTPEARAELDL
jgi:metal-sulfur cluster biosynthetic enzyme